MKQLITTSKHLYQPPLYGTGSGCWSNSYIKSVKTHTGDFIWDSAAILSMLSFGYPCGDRTLIRDIFRQPWLSNIQNDQIILEPIPPHDLYWESNKTIAKNLHRLLLEELHRACSAFDNIFILLSGGLDSRIVAGLLGQLYQEGFLSNTPVAVTWGIPNSRDIIYGRRAAEICGLDWQHIPLQPEHVLENMHLCAEYLAALVSPIHLHRMSYFRNAPANSLVLAGSYGDSVGRAEFSKRHVLDLQYLKPFNFMQLLRQDYIPVAHADINNDLKALHDRCPNKPQYVHCEHEMQGHYMRGMIAHCMSLINTWTSTYQVFTHPSVYSYMWSIHPSCRTDAIYAELLEIIDPRLASLPWSRTNRALKGRTYNRNIKTSKSFHSYSDWISGELFDDIAKIVDPDWFSQINLFEPKSIYHLTNIIRNKNTDYGIHSYYIWTWLASLRIFYENIIRYNIEILSPRTLMNKTELSSAQKYNSSISSLRYKLRNNRLIYKHFNKIRSLYHRYQAKYTYPPKKRT